MSIDWAMWFALGFLSAGILALLTMTAVWRRAVRLTTRRVLDSVPTEVETVRAEKDLLRARHARDGRRFEMALADLRRRNADERLAVDRGRVEIGRLGEALEAERAAKAAAEAETARQAAIVGEREMRIAALEAELGAAHDHETALDRSLGERDDGIARLVEEHRRAVTDAAAEHEAAMADLAETHAADRAEIERELDAARVEIEARKTTIAALEQQLRSMRFQVAEATALQEEAQRGRGLADTSAAQERDRADRLDRRIERLVADVADREERAARSARELDRARQALVFANARAAASGGEPAAGDNLLHTLEQLERRNHELEDRLAGLGRTTAPEKAVARPEAGEDLRETLADLAARIVNLTSLVEGVSSPIGRIVAAADTTPGGPTSLAERIRDLQRRAEAASAAAGVEKRRV